MTYGLSDSLDRINTLDFGVLMNESMQPEVGIMWNKLMEVNHRKCEQLSKICFSVLTLERLKERMAIIYERIPLIECIDNKPVGGSSIYNDFDLMKQLLQSNVETLDIPFTKCKDVIEMFCDRFFEFQNIFSDENKQSNIQRTKEQVKQLTADIKDSILPTELSTPDAMEIWDKARKADWINDDYTFKGTKYQMAYAAEIMGRALGLKPKWKPFEILWGYKYFPQTRRESKERIGKVEREKDIEEVFSISK